MKQVYLSLAAIVRNVDHYVQEWLTFHHLIGVERFIIVLHDCEDETERKIRELPFRDDIIIHYYEEFAKPGAYIPIFSHKFIHREYGGFTKWMLHIDSDEYFFGTTEDHLPSILERYEEFGGLAAHWLVFGPNGHVLKPTGLSIEAFTKRKVDAFPGHTGVKTVYQPSKVVALCSSHLQITDPPTVREDFKPIDMKSWSAPAPWSHEVIRCNHYYTRSMEDWVQRTRNRIGNTIYTMRPEFGTKEFQGHEGGVEDHTILRFSDRLKAVLQF